MFHITDGREYGVNAVVDIEIETEAVMGLKKGNQGLPADAAIIRISPIPGQYYGRIVKIVDLRSKGDTKHSAAEVAQGLTKMNLAKRFGGQWLEGKFATAEAEAKVAWSQAFRRNAKVTLGSEKDDKGRTFPVVFLTDPDTTKPVDGLLMVTKMTTGTGIGAYSYRADYYGSFLRKATAKGTGETMHFAMITFSSIDAPVMIIERVFADDEMVMTDHNYKLAYTELQRVCAVTEEEWLVGAPDGAEESETDGSVEHPTISFAEKLGIEQTDILLLIDAGYDTLEKLAEVKTNAGVAGEINIALANLNKAKKAAKAIVGEGPKAKKTK